MAVPSRRFSLWRMAVLLVALTSETALGVLLYGLGWYEAGGLLRWLACLLLALLPALAAIVVLSRKRFRFSLRALLAATALVALFMLASVRPVLEARQSRRVSLQLAAAGAWLNDPRGNDDDYFQRIGFDPQCSPLPDPNDEGTPVWLRPLLSDVLAVPRDDQVFTLMIKSSGEAEILCANASRLPRLEVLSIAGPISSESMERLSAALSQFHSLRILWIADVPIPEHWLSELGSASALFLVDDRSKHRLTPGNFGKSRSCPNGT